MLPSEKIEKEEPVLKVKFWTVIVCCTVLAYVQNWVNIVSIQYWIPRYYIHNVVQMQLILYTQRRQMATLDAPKVLLLTDKTKLTLAVALTLTDTVTVIFFKRILSTPMKRLYRNNKKNLWRHGSGVCGWARFFRFLTFYPFADKNSIVSSYFIVEKRVFCGDI